MRGDLFQASLTLQKCVWNLEAEAALADTFDDIPAHCVAQWVDAGIAELWKVDDDSWLITEVENAPRVLFVWCYAGRNARRIAEALRRIANRNGIDRVQFSTYHKGLPRLISNVSPRLIGQTNFGANLYEFIAQP